MSAQPLWLPPSGEGLFQGARALSLPSLADAIRPAVRSLTPPLHSAVRGSLDQSLDAMLELRTDLQTAGKAYMARALLRAEAAAQASVEDRLLKPCGLLFLFVEEPYRKCN